MSRKISRFSRSVKLAISLPKGTYDEIESLRQRLALKRSAVILEALLLWLDGKFKEELEQKYVQGYKRIPEKAADVEALYRAGLQSFTQEEW